MTHLQPGEFIALTNPNNPTRVAAYNMMPGTVVRLKNATFALVASTKGPHTWVHAQTGHQLNYEQFAARMRSDTTNLPTILYDPLDTKENND